MRVQKEVYAGFYAGWSFVLSLIACAGILQAYYSLDCRWLAFSFAGVFSLAVLLHRMNQHDLLTAVAPAPLPIPPPAQTLPPARPTFRPMVTAPEPHKVLVGKFAFSDDQIAKIALVVKDAGGTFSRDVVETARAVPDIKKVWADLKADFERCGFVQNNRLTQAGWQWLDSPTLPHEGA